MQKTAAHSFHHLRLAARLSIKMIGLIARWWTTSFDIVFDHHGRPVWSVYSHCRHRDHLLSVSWLDIDAEIENRCKYESRNNFTPTRTHHRSYGSGENNTTRRYMYERSIVFWLISIGNTGDAASPSPCTTKRPWGATCKWRTASVFQRRRPANVRWARDRPLRGKPMIMTPCSAKSISEENGGIAIRKGWLAVIPVKCASNLNRILHGVSL